MEGQDWEPVVLKKTTKSLGSASAAARSSLGMSGALDIEARSGAARHASSHLQKLEDSTDAFGKQPTVGAALSKAICQARLAKKLTQAQLATAINERAQIIQEYENGKAIPNPNVLNKLDKALGVHLPREKKK